MKFIIKPIRDVEWAKSPIAGSSMPGPNAADTGSTAIASTAKIYYSSK